MRILEHYPTVDAADIETEAAFWAALLGGEVADADAEGADAARWRDVVVGGRTVLGIQRADDHVPPTWPADGVPLQMHLDLYVERAELTAAVEEAIALGARSLQAPEDPSASSGFHVLADPAGHPFCLCWD